MSKLNLWYRLGIVLSVIYLAGATYAGYQASMVKAANFASLIVKDCEERTQGNPNQRCYLQYEGVYNAGTNGALTGAFMAAAVPLPFAWLAAFLAIWSVKWIWRGRNASK